MYFKVGSDKFDLSFFINFQSKVFSSMLKNIDAVSFSTYRRIFLNQFNLKFISLKKDTCNTCDSFAARIQSAHGSAKEVLEEAHNKHIDL